MNRTVKIAALMVADAVMVSVALFAAISIRFDFGWPQATMGQAGRLLPFFVVAALLTFHLFRLYNGLWQYTNLYDVARIGTASALSAAWLILFIQWFQIEGFPRSVPLIVAGLVGTLIGINRLSVRVYRRILRRRATPVKSVRSLIIGAGDAGVMLVEDLMNYGARPIGFLDDDPAKWGVRFRGVPVLGDRHALLDVCEKHRINDVIIAMPSVPRHVIRDIYEIARQVPDVAIRVVPALFDIAAGKVEVAALRPIDLSDLLGREPVEIDVGEIARYIQGRRVMVTGAGGSIGAELCRQIADFEPAALYMLDHDENGIFDIMHELRASHHDIPHEPLITDVRDAQKMLRVFEAYRPQVVFHAAAHKHVSFMEDEPEEAVKTNVFGTEYVARAAMATGCESFVLISTDKAVNPTSVMGASKRVAEYVVQHLGAMGSTRFMAVRFGNVLGSRGSVVPLFQRQIAAGGPVTVTDPEMIRYFMTIPEACQLVLQAGALGRGGEVFVLDMGDPVKIVDLATTLIQLQGLEPGTDIEIAFTGRKPGEKLYEELLTDEEGIDATHHDRVFSAKVSIPANLNIDQMISQLREAVEMGHREFIVDKLVEYVPTFEPEHYRMREAVGMHDLTIR